VRTVSDIRRIEEDGNYEKRSLTAAILTGGAAGTANAVVTEAIGAIKKKPKDDK